MQQETRIGKQVFRQCSLAAEHDVIVVVIVVGEHARQAYATSSGPASSATITPASYPAAARATASATSITAIATALVSGVLADAQAVLTATCCMFACPAVLGT